MSSTLSTAPAPRRRRRWLVPVLIVVAWLLVSGATGPFAGKLSEVIENDNAAFLPANAEATLAITAQKKLVGENQPIVGTLIFEYADGVTPAAQAKVDALIAKIPSLAVEDGKTVGDFLLPVPVGSQVSQDGNAISTLFFFDSEKSNKPFASGKSPIAISVQAIREEMKAEGLDGHVGGLAGLFGDLIGVFSAINGSLLYSTVGVVFIILIFVYRSPLLPIIVLLAVGIGDALAQAVVYFMAKAGVIDLNGQSQGILSVLVLGAATDYALLLISRYREELHHHDEPVQAMKAALKGVFEPIVASGATVIAALLVLLLSDLSGNRGLGPVGAIGIAAAMVVILTLLPALLVAFGRWVFWPRIPRNDDVNIQLTGTWAKIGSAVERRPRKLWILTALVLSILAGFSTTLNARGLSTADAFTQRPDSVVGLELLGQHFPGGSGQPTEVIVTQGLVDSVSAALLKVEGVSSVEPMRISPVIPGQALSEVKVIDGMVVLNATLALNPDSVEARELIPLIREAVHAVDPNILVGGSTAVAYDTDVSANRDNRTIIPIVLVLITLILGLLLRSILSAALLLGTVVLSFFATLGACQLVFEHIFGFKGADTSFPLFAFIFLVALGIDYNIFLMTRVREESAKIGTRAGVIKGLTVTGGVITSAGIVLAATFGVLGVLPLVFLAELGFAVAFGVLLDTLIVRTILVPALVHDIGGKVWWPSKLQNR